LLSVQVLISLSRDVDVTESGVHIDNRFVDVSEFPIGIRPEEFDDLLNESEVQDTISTLEQQLKGMKVIVGVDRMDYIKGIPEKLRAFDKFLVDFPARKEKVKLIQVAIPSREGCPEYVRLVHEVNVLVSEINGKHSMDSFPQRASEPPSQINTYGIGSVTYTPIRFIHHSICKKDLAALYAVSDICLVTSIRDGMNLVSYEYVACQQGHGGTLILSKHTGAADTLRGSLLVDPTNADEIAQTIERALDMDEEERKRRQQASLETVRIQTRYVCHFSNLGEELRSARPALGHAALEPGSITDVNAVLPGVGVS
jgi:trehalose 6-phosphate synthase